MNAPRATTLTQAFHEQADLHRDDIALIEFDGLQRTLTWGAWAAAVHACTTSLQQAGHAPGERALILAGNGLLWPVADLAVQQAGMVSVGAFPTSAPVQVAQLVADSDATVAFVDSPERLAAVMAARLAHPRLRTVVMDGHDAPAHEGIVSWTEWLHAGARAAPQQVPVSADDVAVIIYTSGSTGEPKGACLTHRYLIASADSLCATFGFSGPERSLSFLPFSHSAERVFGHVRRILTGDVTLLLSDHRQLWDAARSFQPTVFGGLPRFFEKLHDALVAKRRTLTGVAAASWDRGVELGLQRSRARRAGDVVDAELEARWKEASAPARAELASRLGSDIRVATSGGAALPVHVVELLDACGLTVLGAYGMTEHLCVAAHRPDGYGFEGVGRPMPGTTLRIADDGEILVRRCDLTFSGYLNRPDETASMFTPDGEWLRTGDIGRVDGAGVLHVTGRRKELIALSTGKKVAPAPIEARLVEHPWITQALVYGEGRSYVTALLVLDADAVAWWAEERGIAGSWPELQQHPLVRMEIEIVIDNVNVALSAPERIRRYAVAEREFSAEHGEVTPTLKLRRDVVENHFAAALQSLYVEEPA